MLLSQEQKYWVPFKCVKIHVPVKIGLKNYDVTYNVKHGAENPHHDHYLLKHYSCKVMKLKSHRGYRCRPPLNEMKISQMKCKCGGQKRQFIHITWACRLYATFWVANHGSRLIWWPGKRKMFFDHLFYL